MCVCVCVCVCVLIYARSFSSGVKSSTVNKSEIWPHINVINLFPPEKMGQGYTHV